ncbi:MAG: hypothetical protein SFV52_00655 [Saprospiraceae bacterium]|nr:hypothetical protein [Saprospiraceae bacterium]
MARTPSDNLFYLIKAMSPAEKRHFRLSVPHKPDSGLKYRLLFDTMDALTEPDEARVRLQVYGGEPGGNKFPELKRYLYDLILKSLVSFDEQSAPDRRSRHYLDGVEALFRRGMYDDCAQLLQRAARSARYYEDFAGLLDVLNWEKKLAYTQMDADFLHRHLEKIHTEEEQTLRQLQNEQVYRKAFFEMYRLVKEDARQQTRVESPISLDPLLFADPKSALSHKARVLYYRTTTLYLYMSQQYDLFRENGVQLLQLLESRPHFLNKDLSDYIATLSNLILACGLTGQFSEVEHYLDKLKHLRPITEDDRQKIHRQYFTNKFVLCMYTGRFREAYAEMLQCKEAMRRFNPKSYGTASFYFQYTCICLGCGEYREALDYLNQWQNQPRSVEREDLQSLGRILQLILHYELNNTLLLDSLQRSATRFLRKKNRYSAFERRFFRLIHQLTAAQNEQEKRELFLGMQADMRPWKTDTDVQALLQTFDLEAWIESHIASIAYDQAVVAKRYAKV